MSMSKPAFPGRNVQTAQDSAGSDAQIELRLVEKIEQDVEAKGAAEAILVLAIDSAPTSKIG